MHICSLWGEKVSDELLSQVLKLLPIFKANVYRLNDPRPDLSEAVLGWEITDQLHVPPLGTVVQGHTRFYYAASSHRLGEEITPTGIHTPFRKRKRVK